MSKKALFKNSMKIHEREYSWDVTFNPNGSQVVQYNLPGLPIELHDGKLSYCKNMRCSCHWHDDLEFIIMKSGELDYQVNKTTYRLNSESAIMTNSNRMHFGTAVNKQEATYISLLLHPSLLCASPYFESEYVNPLIFDDHLDAVVFSNDVVWQRECITLLKRIVFLLEEQKPTFGLEMQQAFLNFWSILYQNTALLCPSAPYNDKKNIEIKSMIEYINNNFAQQITLEQIANAGMVCRSKCCSLFKKFLHQSAFEYLLNVRIENSIKLLNKRQYTISEIAIQCGFNNSSYFTETFHKLTGETPTEYLKRLS